jgi:Cu/Ag efflux pump CusA
MKRSILTITATIALAIPAVASAATITESFNRDMDRNYTQVSTKTISGQDSFQQYVNRAINGSDTLIASFDRDMYRTATPATSMNGNTDSIQQQINVALTGEKSNTLIASFDRDMNRTATPATSISGYADSVQQLVNVALTGEKSNTLIASFDRDLNRTAIPAVSATYNADSIQQLVNVALNGNNNTLIANFERVIGIEITTVANYQNTFQWNHELFTAFA